MLGHGAGSAPCQRPAWEVPLAWAPLAHAGRKKVLGREGALSWPFHIASLPVPDEENCSQPAGS